MPGAAAGRHIEEVVKKAPVTGRIRHRALRGVPEESQGSERTLDRFRPADEPVLDRDGIAGKGQSHAGDAGGGVVA